MVVLPSNLYGDRGILKDKTPSRPRLEIDEHFLLLLVWHEKQFLNLLSIGKSLAPSPRQ
jgi:hypothetical protein